jgi:hypothetical protein
MITKNQIYLFNFLELTLFQNNHNAGCKKEEFSDDFDGKSNVLAHAFFQNYEECQRIHLKKNNKAIMMNFQIC